MKTIAKTATLLGAFAVFLGGIYLGFNLLFSTAEVETETQRCVVRELAEGDEISSTMVTVNVYNASNRAGLANRVSINLDERGFASGQVGNNPGEIAASNVTILTDDPENVAVRLVAQQFSGDIQYEDADFEVGDGVTILVGQDHNELRADAPTTLTNESATSLCVPPADPALEQLDTEEQLDPQ